MTKSRIGTDSFKGYTYQYYFFIKTILSECDDIDYIVFEGCEDIGNALEIINW